MPGKFVILKNSGGQYFFVLRSSGNSETILTSESYISKQGAQGGIGSVQANSQIDSRYENRTSINSQHYFVLKGANGEIIGTSETYTTTASRDNGKAAVKRDAPGATVEDLS